MEIKPAQKSDLPKLKEMYRRICENMTKNGFEFRNKVYHCEFLADDINKERLYILTNGDEIAPAFALCVSDAGENYIEWENNKANALYIERLGVNVAYLGRDVGMVTIDSAIVVAKEKGAKYLRLFVVDENKPALMMRK